MAKKYQQRTHVSVRKKKEEEKKRQQRKEFVQKHLQQIISLVTLAVILITGVILAVDYLGTPEGSMRVFMGKVLGAEENTLVANLGENNAPRYYTVAWYTPHEGYSPDPSFFVSGDSNEQRMFFRADDENEMIETVAFSGIRQKTAAEYIEQLRSMSSAGYSSCTEAREGVIAGHNVHYVYATIENTFADPETGEIPDEVSASLIAYADTIRNSCIYLGVTSRAYPQDQLPTEEMMLAAAEEYFANVEILQPDGTRK